MRKTSIAAAFTCPDNKGGKRATDDESQLCDNDVMVVLALIKATCLTGFPCYAPCPCALHVRDWIFRLTVIGSTGDAYKSRTSDVTNPRHIKFYQKQAITQSHCKTPFQRNKSPSGSVTLLSCCDR